MTKAKLSIFELIKKRMYNLIGMIENLINNILKLKLNK